MIELMYYGGSSNIINFQPKKLQYLSNYIFLLIIYDTNVAI